MTSLPLDVKTGDRLFVYRINQTKYKLKIQVASVDGSCVVCTDGWFYDVSWCKPIVRIKGIIS